MKVRVLYPGSIYDRNGAAKVIRVFADYQDRFKSLCGHDIYVTDNIYETIPDSRKEIVEKKSMGPRNYPRKQRSVFNRLVKQIMGAQLTQKYSQSYYNTKRFIERYYWGRGRQIIEKYRLLGYDDDAFVFHDIFSCWAYVDFCKKNYIIPKKYILVLHTNGEVFKMMLINYPVIEGTRYYSIMTCRAEKCLEFAQRIVFVSEASAEQFYSTHPNFKNKVEVVYNGIAYQCYDSDPVFDGKIRMVTVGTVCKRKNQVVLVDSLAVIRKYFDATLMVIGGGDALEECKQRAKDLKVEQWIRFLGSIDDVAGELKKCNLFVLPSKDEGLPIAAIEALRAKLPLVLTNVGGCGELIRNNGFLVEPDMDSISSAIIEFAKDIEKQKEMSKASFDLYNEKFTLDAMICGYSRIINDVVH